jgi:hypothetical protein
MSGRPGWCEVVDRGEPCDCEASSAAHMSIGRVIGVCDEHACCLILFGIPVHRLPSRPMASEPGS